MAWLEEKKSGFYIRDSNPKYSQPLGKISKTDANAALHAYETKKAQRGPSMAHHGTVPLKEMIDNYLHEMAKSWTNETIKGKRYTLKYFAATTRLLRDVTTAHLSWWKSEMIKQGLAIDTVAIRLRDVRAFLGWCVKEGKIQSNPFTIGIPGGRKDAGRDLTPEQIKAFMEALKKSSHPMILPFTIFALYTGARRGEILRAKFEDIDRRSRLWTIPYAKGDKKRVVPLHDMVIGVLPKRTKGLIFPLDEHSIRWHWAIAKKEAGIKGRLRIHDMRHNFASYYMRQTGDWMGLMEICGWSSVAMAKRYTHLGKHHLTAKIDAFSFS